MQHYILVNRRDEYNKKIQELYYKNYSYDMECTPEYRYGVIKQYCDMFFHLIDSNDMILACCSVNIKDNKHVIDDVFVEEEFRGNNYAMLLLLNVMKNGENENLQFHIIAHDTNIPAVKTYQTIFGDPYKIEKNMLYFH
jgi:hypothetical protein